MIQSNGITQILIITTVLFQFGAALKIGCAEVYLGNSPQQRTPVNETTRVTFRLFTRKNPTEYQELRINDTEALLNSNFNRSVPTKIYAPGWSNDGNIAHSARDEYFKRGDYNFFTILWLSLQENLVDIEGVLQATTVAGDYTGAFINFLIENGAPLSSFHIMGHSAGAHVAGATGPAVIYGKVPRITGLDPAKADVWSLNDPSTCIEKTDAEFVDIMHTNGNDPSNDGIAFDEPMGHADFYVNGGKVQPNCPMPDDGSCCSHCRAVDLFKESINSPIGFVSLRCSSYEDYTNGTCDGNLQELMGDPTSPRARGKYYVDTNVEPPFAMG